MAATAHQIFLRAIGRGLLPALLLALALPAIGCRGSRDGAGPDLLAQLPPGVPADTIRAVMEDVEGAEIADDPLDGVTGSLPQGLARLTYSGGRFKGISVRQWSFYVVNDRLQAAAIAFEPTNPDIDRERLDSVTAALGERFGPGRSVLDSVATSPPPYAGLARERPSHGRKKSKNGSSDDGSPNGSSPRRVYVWYPLIAEKRCGMITYLESDGRLGLIYYGP